MEKSKITWVRENYSRLVSNPEDIQSVVIGGSVARNYPDDGGDIDIIYFMKSQEMYRKEKKTVDDILIELHYVPLKFVFLLLETIEPVIDVNKWGCNNDSDMSYLWGEKLCPHQKKSENNKVLLAAWRELRKLLDTIVIYDSDAWYEKNMAQYKSIKGDKEKILNVMSGHNDMSSLESIIEGFKFYSIARGDVFSKVFWTDYYINNMNDEKIESAMKNVFEIDGLLESVLTSWINIVQERLEIAVQEHKKLSDCSICKGEFVKCNIGRCGGDYLFDACRATERKYKISAVLCIRRAYEYIKKAYAMYGMEMEMPADWYEYWDRVKENCNNSKASIINLLFDKVD